MKCIKSLFITFIFVSFSFVNAHAFLSSDDIGSTTAQFLKLGIGAKSAAMGNAVTSINNGTDAIYWNPANLIYIDKKELSFSHAIWFEDVNYEWLSFALPTTEYGVFGFGLQYVSYGSIDKVDNTNTSDGSFSPLDMALYLSYANSYDRLNFGLNLKYIYSKIEESASAIALDLGATYKLYNDKTFIGAALTNLGTSMKFNKESEELPLLFKIGASHYLLDEWLVSLDLNFPKDNEFYFNFGTQYSIEIADDLNFALRVGYEGRNKDIPGFNWINLGFGFEYLDYKFDYAFVPYGDIGMTHRFSFGIKFGKKVDKIDLAEQERRAQQETNVPSQKKQAAQEQQQVIPEVKENDKPAEKVDAQQQSQVKTEVKDQNKQQEQKMQVQTEVKEQSKQPQQKMSVAAKKKQNVQNIKTQAGKK